MQATHAIHHQIRWQADIGSQSWVTLQRASVIHHQLGMQAAHAIGHQLRWQAADGSQS